MNNYPTSVDFDEDLVDAVTRTVEIMVREASEKPGRRTWPEDATQNWSRDFIKQIVDCEFTHDCLKIIKPKCDPVVLSQIERIWKEDISEQNVSWREMGRFRKMNESLKSPSEGGDSRSVDGDFGGIKEFSEIKKYFKKLEYPKIAGIRPVFLHELGNVFVVTFGSDTPITQPIPMKKPCYAIIVNGVVSGYNEDFWSDADKYKLVLKCHLGLLAMDAHELKKSQPPEPEKKPNIAPQVGVSAESINALVARYEDLLAAARRESDRWEARESQCSEANNRLREKINKISAIISGEDESREKLLATAKAVAESDPVGCAIDGADENFDAVEAVADSEGYNPQKSRHKLTGLKPEKAYEN